MKNSKPIAYIKSFYLALIVFLMFGVSAVGKAAQKMKKKVKGAKDNLRSSYGNYMTSKAWGYFRPSWQANSDLPPPLADDMKVLSDPDNLIEKNFLPSSALRGRVGFWVDVYSRFTSHYRIVHDRENPELIYGYLDFRPLYRTFPPRLAASKARAIEKRVLKELKEKIAEATGVTNPKVPTMSPEEKQAVWKMVSAFGGSDSEKALKFSRRIRTQSGQKDHFLKGIERSKKYLPFIEMIFKKAELPLALTRLPFVESSFNPGAGSKVGAIGMWQFMPDTARLFDRKGTRKDWADPMKQSRNAARMFKILYERLDDWGIAVTAYNSGGARLQRIKDKYGCDDIEELLEVPSGKDTLGFAGRNFYAELLAANIVEHYKDKLFSPATVQASKLNVSRRVQSLLETLLSEKGGKATAAPKKEKLKVIKGGKPPMKKKARYGGYSGKRKKIIADARPHAQQSRRPYHRGSSRA